MTNRLCTVVGALGMVFLLAGVSAYAETGKAVYDMEEVSVFDLGGQADALILMALQNGQTVSGSSSPRADVKKYPELKSKQPIYGSVTLGRASDSEGRRYQFVIDESKPAGEKAAEEKAADAPASEDQPAADGEPKYDTLYFDADGDLDLTNDPVITLLSSPPARIAALRSVAFDYVCPKLHDGSSPGPATLKLLPLLQRSRPTRPAVAFVVPTVRKAKIKIGDKSFNAILMQTGRSVGRYDGSNTALLLTTGDKPLDPLSLLTQRSTLGGLNWMDGEYYEMSTSPSGDKLTVAPYEGDCGVLKISAGDREGIDKLGIAGIVQMGETMLPVGEMSMFGTTEKPTAEHKVPVGDHTPLYFVVELGNLQVMLSPNYYSTEKPYERLKSPPKGTLKIRKDEPVVFNFSNKPLVLFTAPTEAKKFKPGEALRVSATIVDPDMNMGLRGLRDLANKLPDRTINLGTGQTIKLPQFASLDPTVKITNSSGKVLAEGKMPFG